MIYEDYLKIMRTIRRNEAELAALLDEACEDPDISCSEFEDLWFVWRNILRGGGL